ncbi:MAG: pilin [Patescibacteria group bacterium]
MRVAEAQTKYQLLESIDGTSEVDVGPNQFEYFSTVYGYALTLTVALAVLMIVIGGIQYTLSYIPGVKEEAKGRIWGAIGGLLLALFSYLILETINPRLVSPNLALTQVSGPSGGTGGTGGGLTGGQGGSAPLLPGRLSDQDARALLLGATNKNISFDLPNCNTNGNVSPCGDFDNVTPATINYIFALADKCSTCQIVVRDATSDAGSGHSEAGHYDGIKIDLAPTASLNMYIVTHFQNTGKYKSWDLYSDSGNVWMNEDYAGTGKDHWDITVKQ